MTHMTYDQALRWLIDNDDCSWLDDDEPSPSVTAILVADIYNATNDSSSNT
jgi:hypothetical protein